MESTSEHCAIVCGTNAIAVIPLDSGLLFWHVTGNRFLVVPAIDESGQRMAIDDLRGLPCIEWVPSPEFFAECSEGCHSA